jgi:hypothetical protein
MRKRIDAYLRAIDNDAVDKYHEGRGRTKLTTIIFDEEGMHTMGEENKMCHACHATMQATDERCHNCNSEMP